MCIGEFVAYGLKMKNGPTCTDDAGTCGRSLCECDKRFAQQHVDAVRNTSRESLTNGFIVDACVQPELPPVLD